MRTKGLWLAGASAMLLVAVPASAATTINWAPQSTNTGSSSDFDSATQTFAGVFADSFKFDPDPANLYLQSGYYHNHGTGSGFTISAIINGLDQQIYASGPLNGNDFALTSVGTVSFSGGTVTGISLKSNQVISQAFHSFFPSQTFTLNGAPNSAVPEPATWAMMLLGFGFVGAAMRKTSRVNYTFA
jgi:hypothetical protein